MEYMMDILAACHLLEQCPLQVTEFTVCMHNNTYWSSLSLSLSLYVCATSAGGFRTAGRRPKLSARVSAMQMVT
jgi:hypothetical protein